MLSTGVVLSTGAAAIHLLASDAIDEIALWLEDGLSRAVFYRPDPVGALIDGLTGASTLLIPFLGVLAGTAMILNALPALVSKKGKGRTSVELPGDGRPGAGSLVLTGFSVVLFLVFALSIFTGFLGQFSFETTPEGATELVVEAAVSLMACAGAVLCVAGLAEIALERGRIWRSLHLSTGEARWEARDATGDRTVRARIADMARAGGNRDR